MSTDILIPSLEPYVGPVVADEDEDPAVEGGGLWLQEYGAVLEVRRSVGVPGGGLGLFLRLEHTGEVTEVVLPAGVPLCGESGVVVVVVVILVVVRVVSSTLVGPLLQAVEPAAIMVIVVVVVVVVVVVYCHHHTLKHPNSSP